jgi:chemotaxis protein MotA
MFAIIGIVVVLGAVFGGFMLEGGHMHVLFQPIELLIIGGAAMGSFLIAAPKSVIITSIKKGLSIFTAKEASTSDFLDLLTLLYEIMNIARREGIVALEAHVNKPDGSAISGASNPWPPTTFCAISSATTSRCSSPRASRPTASTP